MVAVLLIYVLLTGLAATAVGGEAVPSGIGARLRLAGAGVAKLFGQAAAFFRMHGNTIVLIVGVMAIGAVAGVATYMLKRESHSKETSHSARRVRRKRRK